MQTLKSRYIREIDFENFEVWRENQSPPLNRSQGLAALLAVFFEEHEKELRKMRAKKEEKADGKLTGK